MKVSLLDLLPTVLSLALMAGVALYLRRFMHGVADFLAAGRGAGRYLIATASGESAAGVLGLVAAMEVFSQAGFSIQLWSGLTGVLYLLVVISGFVTFRLRETRVLTLHQFLEVRYSRNLRIFASILTFVSGAFFYGVVPGVSARFFVGYLGLPETMSFGFVALPTFWLLMLASLGLALFFTVTSGQIGVMVTDSLEFIISLFMYLIVAAVVLGLFSQPMVSLAQVEEALLGGESGASFINPLDIGTRQDFNGWYVVIGFLLLLYNFRGSASANSASSAHESRMAGILGTWRGVGTTALLALLSVGAFTLLHHPDFAIQQAEVRDALSRIDNPQIQTKMRMPVALGHLLPQGVLGCFLAVGVLGTIAGIGAYCMQMGSGFIQDVLLPLRGRPLEQGRQVRWLRRAVAGFGLFTVMFSMFFKPADYLQMLMFLIGSIYLGGAGIVILGGLYWSRGTTIAAWAALITGAVVATTGWMLQTFWSSLAATTERFPLNGQVMSLITAALCILIYGLVSLWTCKEPHNMRKLLHRGAFAVKDDQEAAPDQGSAPRHLLARLLQIDAHFTRGDRLLAYLVFLYTLFWNAAFLVILAWNTFVAAWPDRWWWNFVLVQNILMPLIIGVINTFWFSGGALLDLARLKRRLQGERIDPQDDGQVHDNTLNQQ